MAKPLRGREKGTEGRANLNKATHTHGGKRKKNTKEKKAKHANKQKGERGTAAQAQREEAVPMGKTHRRASSPKKAARSAHTHCRERRREETTAKLASKQKGAGRRTAAREKRKEAAPSGKSNSFASTSMIQNQGRDGEQT